MEKETTTINKYSFCGLKQKNLLTHGTVGRAGEIRKSLFTERVGVTGSPNGRSDHWTEDHEHGPWRLTCQHSGAGPVTVRLSYAISSVGGGGEFMVQSSFYADQQKISMETEEHANDYFEDKQLSKGVVGWENVMTQSHSAVNE